MDGIVFLKESIKLTYDNIALDFGGTFVCVANYDKPIDRVFQSKPSKVTVLCKLIQTFAMNHSTLITLILVVIKHMFLIATLIW